MDDGDPTQSMLIPFFFREAPQEYLAQASLAFGEERQPVWVGY